MDKRRLLITASLVAVLAMLAGSTSLSLSAPPNPQAATTADAQEVLTTSEVLAGMDGEDEAGPESPGRTDVAIHGTTWRPEWPRRFSLFKVMGWGTETKSKNANGSEWVHVAVPMITRLEGRLQKIRKVEFCARSTNGAATRPIRVDLWGGKKRFVTQAIAWPADNKCHCFWVSFNPPVWKEDLGVSVLLYFANTSDKITLHKAWVQLED
ncbi:MAG: hypothetical protein H5T59_09770 [Anaerolineae bacterium]|nr:hypothetical protein [Anaerolineae bacterium]